MIIYVSIGNSDDKLTQQRWSDFTREVHEEVRAIASQIHGVWASLPMQPYQNMCFCFELGLNADKDAKYLRGRFAELASEYQQDSIAWAVAETEFIRSSATPQNKLADHPDPSGAITETMLWYLKDTNNLKGYEIILRDKIGPGGSAHVTRPCKGKVVVELDFPA
jgi:hypothetical protein